MTTARRFILASIALLAIACSDDTSTGPGNGAVASVSVSPATRQLVIGEEFTPVAKPLDSRGREIGGRTIAWSTSDDDIVQVNASGKVIAIAEGVAQVTAAADGKSGKVTVTVVRPAVASVDLDVTEVNLEEGATRQLVATPKDANGQPLSGRGIQWSSSDAARVRVDALGLLTAIRPGRVTVTARVEGKTAEATVIVSANYDHDLIYDGWSGVAGVAPELWAIMINSPDGMPARLFPNKEARDVSPSPDGSRVALVAYQQGRPQIIVAEIGSSVGTRLTSDYADDQPSWSPDGTKIAFRRASSLDPLGSFDVWVMNADGTGATNLTADQEHNQHSPAWSPALAGGYRLVYSSQSNTPNGTAHLWTMAIDGSDKQQITSGDVFDVQPTWSPDGSTIAFERHGTIPGGAIYNLNAANPAAGAQLLVDLPFGQFAPAWSPDGKLVAFASKVDGLYQIFTVWADGSKVAQRTFDATDKQNPGWLLR